MSAAQVINTTMSTPVSRVGFARGSGQSTIDSVEALDTNFATRGRDEYAREEQFDSFDGPPQRRRRGEFQDEVVRFSGVLLSREVGTTMVQAQAANSRQPVATVTAFEAERNVAMYEFNQALVGAPEVTTSNGVMH